MLHRYFRHFDDMRDVAFSCSPTAILPVTNHQGCNQVWELLGLVTALLTPQGSVDQEFAKGSLKRCRPKGWRVILGRDQTTYQRA